MLWYGTVAEELMAFARKLGTRPSAVTPAQLTALSAKLSLFAANFADFTAKTIAKAGLKPVPMGPPTPAPEPATVPAKTPTTEEVAATHAAIIAAEPVATTENRR